MVEWRLSRRALAAELGILPRDLEALARNPDHYYKNPSFKSRGPDRPPRRFDTAGGRLRPVHKAFNKLLQREAKVPENVFGGLHGSWTLNCASPHRGAECIVKIDLRDYFPSITGAMVERMFQRQLGCSRQVARMSARLLTRTVGGKTFLPQGCCASTIVANLVLVSAGRRITEAAEQLGVKHTRYVDDLIFSGPRAADMIPIARGILKGMGLSLSMGKLKVMPRQRAQEVLGIDVKSEPRPQRSFRQKAFALVHKVSSATGDERKKLMRTLEGMRRYSEGFEGGFTERLNRAVEKLSSPTSEEVEQQTPR